jgi:hypothetical protein
LNVRSHRPDAASNCRGRRRVHDCRQQPEGGPHLQGSARAVPDLTEDPSETARRPLAKAKGERQSTPGGRVDSSRGGALVRGRWRGTDWLEIKRLFD